MANEGKRSPGPDHVQVIAATVVVVMIVAAFWAERRFRGLDEETTRLAASGSLPPTPPPPGPSPGPPPPTGPAPPTSRPTPPTSQSTEPSPSTVRLSVVLDGTEIVVRPNDVTVAYRTPVEVVNTTEEDCQLGPAIDLPEIANGGDPDLGPQESVTLLAPDKDRNLKLRCLNFATSDFFIRSRQR